MRRKSNKIKSLLPNILGICFILFLSLFSLDSTTFIGFVVHNIPVLLLLVSLVISWKYKYEIVGSVMFILFGFYFISAPPIIYIPAFLIGILFAFNWLSKSATMKIWKRKNKS
jgi:hypothetical protein